MSEVHLNEDGKYNISRYSIVLMIVGMIASLYIHELGHAIGFWLVGIPTHIEFAITSFGPVLITRGMYRPEELLSIWFVAFFGPFFAGVIFMLIGKIRPEAYVSGGTQLFYAPFELMSWVLFGNEGVLNIYILLFVMLTIPGVFVLEWSLDKIEEYNEVKSNSLNR